MTRLQVYTKRLKNCIQTVETASEFKVTPSGYASDGVRILVTASERKRLEEAPEDSAERRRHSYKATTSRLFLYKMVGSSTRQDDRILQSPEVLVQTALKSSKKHKVHQGSLDVVDARGGSDSGQASWVIFAVEWWFQWWF
uniref:Uncharacterized protein n=1 Tax=Tanacetum cinerariifolium TaxID=118510 RepID=A0A699JGH6_TANCI|nr:hypothetical protein [Tanacetum cinerariifolium]